MQIKDIILNEIKNTNYYDNDNTLERFNTQDAGFCERQMFLAKIKGKLLGLDVKGNILSNDVISHYIQSIPEVKDKYDINVQVKTNVPNSNVYYSGFAPLVAKDKSEVIDIRPMYGISRVKDFPNKEHIYQVVVWMNGLGIKKGRIVYVNKSDMEVVEHIVDESPIRLQRAFDKASLVYEKLKDWDNKPKWDKIPIPKDDCWFCKVEVIEPQLKLLLSEEK